MTQVRPSAVSHTVLLMLPNSRIGIQSCVRDNTLDNMPSGFTYYAGSTYYGTPDPQRSHYDYVSG